MRRKLIVTNRERITRVLNFQPVDRLPVIEWAGWWDKTLDRWYGEGLPRELGRDVFDFLGLDQHRQCWMTARGSNCPKPVAHGQPIILSREDYLAVKEYLYPDRPFDEDQVRGWALAQQIGDIAIWITLDGFFWWPRVLFGIEQHMYAFFDQPELMHEINEDLLAYYIRALEQFCDICTPDFMTFAEDLSYNHGPMLSKAHFDEFIAPYYRRIVPELQSRGIHVVIDSDGDVEAPVAWFRDLGVKGILPLERMAGVDVNKLREKYPDQIMIGGFDKTIMHLGEDRMRQEFERLMPAMRSGGYIPSVDHQTPPGVSLEDYRLYVRLLHEYAVLAVSDVA